MKNTWSPILQQSGQIEWNEFVHDFINKKNKDDWKYHVQNMNQSFNPIFIQGMDILLHPFAEDQVQFKEPSLFASIQ